MHHALDAAVAACYGWPAAISQNNDEIVKRLAALNQEIAEGRREYAPFPPKPRSTDDHDVVSASKRGNALGGKRIGFV